MPSSARSRLSIVVVRVAEGESTGRDLVQRCRFAERQDRHLVAAQGASDAPGHSEAALRSRSDLAVARPTASRTSSSPTRATATFWPPRPSPSIRSRGWRSPGEGCAPGGRRQADRRHHHRPRLRLRPTAPTVTVTGAGTGATITATLGHVANPVGVALASIVDRLRAVAFLDGPGTDYEDAVAVPPGLRFAAHLRSSIPAF